MKTVGQFAAALSAAKQEQGVTLAALATNTGLTPLAVRQILDGKVSPRISNAMALASELGLELVLMPKTAAASFESKGGAHLAESAGTAAGSAIHWNRG